MIINHISRVHSETKNLNPIVSILHRKFKSNKIASRLNSSKIEKNQLNIYHFGGVYCFYKFLKFKFYRNKSHNVIFFHGTDLHNYNKDFDFLNKVKSNINYVCNIMLMIFSDYSYIVSNSLIPHIPNLLLKKIKIINLGLDLDNIYNHDNVHANKNLIFVNNNNRGLKNFSLAKKFAKKNNFQIDQLMGLSQKEFFKKLRSAYGLIITSFQEGSPNVLKEAIAYGIKVFTVDVGDCKSNILRFGGTLIDYNSEILNEFKPNKKYSTEYFSIQNTVNQIENDFNLFMRFYNEK